MGSRVDVCVSCGFRFEQERKHGRPRTRCSVCSGVQGAPRLERQPAPVVVGGRADPPVRADGRCAVCLGPRKVTKQQQRYAGDQVALDPFCSSRCCRAYHGCELGDEADTEVSERGRAGADASPWSTISDRTAA